MDPTQMADEALHRFAALQAAANRGNAAVAEEPAARALTDALQHLAKLDGWAKIALDRLVADPENARASADLKLSMEQAARLHPQFMRTLSEACSARGAAAVPLPQQVPTTGQAS